MTERVLRKTVTMEVTRRRRGGDGRVVETTKDVRLYVMSEHQRKVFDEVVARLVLARTCNREEGDRAVEKVVVRLLSGTMPRGHDHAVFHQLRLAFPILKQHQIEQLPRAGCPDGWVTAVNLMLLSRSGRPPRLAHLKLTQEQAISYNDAIVAVQGINAITRDDAWQFVNRTIGALICGWALDPTQHPVLEDLAEHFPMLTDDQIVALPRATEDDVLAWSFTTAPVEVV